MTRHVAAHTLAQLESLVPGARSKALAHIADCDACQSALSRIESSREAMTAIRTQEDPDLGWDHIAARVYWSTSSERRRTERSPSRSVLRWGIPAALAALAVVVVSLTLNLSDDLALKMAVAPPTPEPTMSSPPAAPIAAAIPWSGLVTFAQGEILSDGAALEFDAPVMEGSRFKTGAGVVAVQFGEGSAFRVAAHSELVVRSLNSERIELHIVGLVDVDITRREAGQEFVVVAGAHRVLVRGTAFRVKLRDDELAVSCVRGKVVVTDGSEHVDVVAGAAWKGAALRSMPLAAKELAELEKAMYMPMLPVWSDANASLSSIIEVDAEPGQQVAVDGVVVSEGDFAVRVLGGRHQVSLVDTDGEPGEGKWLDAEPGQRLAAPVAVARPTIKNKSDDRRLRKRQLGERIESAQGVRRCLSPLAKQGLMQGSYVSLEIGINEDGSQGFLNVLDSNLSAPIQRCVKRAVDAVALPQGPSATLRYRIQF